MKKNIDGTAEVNTYMAALEHPFKAEVETLRAIIMNADKRMQERVKWNSPSFYYKFDMAAFHLRASGYVHLVFVFHHGTMIEDRRNLLEGDYKDRRMAKFYSMEDIENKKAVLEEIVREWIALTEQSQTKNNN